MPARPPQGCPPALVLRVVFGIKQARPGSPVTRFWTGVYTGARGVAGSHSFIHPASSTPSTHIVFIPLGGRGQHRARVWEQSLAVSRDDQRKKLLPLLKETAPPRWGQRWVIEPMEGWLGPGRAGRRVYAGRKHGHSVNRSSRGD